MPESSRKPASPRRRMASYRERMRASGLRPLQIWAPDTRNPEVLEKIRREVAALAASDPAGDEIMDWIEHVYEWPER